MGWDNPPVPWRKLAEQLGDGHPRHNDGRPRNAPPTADGGDSPAWSRRRLPYQPPAGTPGTAATPYAELHCHSNFSFLDGASHPEELAEEAARLGLAACALTDHNGLYGVVRFAEAAGALGLRTVFGTEVSVDQTRPGSGVADPDGRHLVLIARDPTGYAALSRAIGLAQLRGRKGRPVVDLDELGALAGDHWLVLTGCRKGAVPRALVDNGLDAARHELDHLIEVFGRCHVKVELWDHGDPRDTARNDGLADLATRCGVEVVVTNNVHYATPRRWRLASAQAAIRARRSLDELEGWLPAAGGAHLRSGDEQAARFTRYPGAVECTTALAISSSFDLRLVAPRLPDFPVPGGHTEATWLRQLTMEGARRRYGPPGDERVPGAYLQIERELATITELGFPGYFLIVWDIVEFCRRTNIYCQGRGSAANSAVCFALGITKADPVALELLFERFLSPARDGPPDIDLDIESGRREEVIQYVYGRYGRHHAAQVANVITYRPRSAIRDAGRALGFSPGQLDRWARRLDGWGPLRDAVAPAGARASEASGGRGSDDPDGGAVHDPDAVPEPVVDLAAQLEGFPRHLGIHSGGMVICDRPVIDVCPVEWATMPDRSVLQWDKDDCAAIGLVKFDLLGLGMLEVLHRAVDLVATHQQTAIDLAHIPQEDAVYRMLSRADSIGVFQVESRAQMATLPRLKPRKFYDLVVEVALIRPGPIQGGSVHPFIRRRNDQEPVTHLHPLLAGPLRKTLGVPLFQEQMMEIAVEVAGFTAAEADELRQAMGAKRSHQRMERLRERFYAGMATRGITGDTADAIYDKLLAFANFGFPESHSVSFAYLVYASAWLKLHHPAAFLAALLNSQPMGFWAAQTLIADAERHGVVVRAPDVHASAAQSTLEPLDPTPGDTPQHRAVDTSPQPDDPQPDGPVDRIPAEQWAERDPADRRLAVRLGLSQIRTIGDDLAERLATGAPYDDLEALVRHARPTVAQAEALATAGALAPLVADRRRALWAAGAAAHASPDQLERTTTGTAAPELESMTLFDEVGADLWATGVTTRAAPMQFVRDRLRAAGVLTAVDLDTAEPDRTVAVGGVVTHRQRPATAGGITFVNLEDETGLVNVICPQAVWARYRTVARTSPALVVHGRLERAEGVVNVVASRLERLDLHLGTTRSRDFH